MNLWGKVVVVCVVLAMVGGPVMAKKGVVIECKLENQKVTVTLGEEAGGDVYWDTPYQSQFSEKYTSTLNCCPTSYVMLYCWYKDLMPSYKMIVDLNSKGGSPPQGKMMGWNEVTPSAKALWKTNFTHEHSWNLKKLKDYVEENGPVAVAVEYGYLTKYNRDKSFKLTHFLVVVGFVTYKGELHVIVNDPDYQYDIENADKNILFPASVFEKAMANVSGVAKTGNVIYGHNILDKIRMSANDTPLQSEWRDDRKTLILRLAQDEACFTKKTSIDTSELCAVVWGWQNSVNLKKI